MNDSSFAIICPQPFVVWVASGVTSWPVRDPDAASLLLKRMNVSAESRLGGALVAYLQQRRNSSRWRPRRNITQHLLNALGGNRAPSSSEDDYYEDYEEYPDYDLSPEAILIYVLELFGTMIGLTWGAVSTIFG